MLACLTVDGQELACCRERMDGCDQLSVVSGPKASCLYCTEHSRKVDIGLWQVKANRFWLLSLADNKPLKSKAWAESIGQQPRGTDPAPAQGQ